MGALPRYLGLDISSYTGYALVEGDRVIKSGVRDLSAKKTEHVGNRGLKFYNFLARDIGPVDEIYFEQVISKGNFKNKEGKWVSATNDGRELYHGLIMVMYMYAAGLSIPTFPVHPSTLKKLFTGYGHAEKADMCRVAHAMGWQGGQAGTALMHDEVDGIALVATQIKRKYGITLKF